LCVCGRLGLWCAVCGVHASACTVLKCSVA
jgi:hypothetical protein